MPEDKRLVYVLKSANPKAHYYIGLTSDVPARLADHNAGRCPHTARYRPWQLHVAIELPDEDRALAFERYLKSRADDLGLRFVNERSEDAYPAPLHSCPGRQRGAPFERLQVFGPAPSINFPVDLSSIGSVADRSEMPSDCRRERSAKWSYLPGAP